jgi:hypothetical protein
MWGQKNKPTRPTREKHGGLVGASARATGMMTTMGGTRAIRQGTINDTGHFGVISLAYGFFSTALVEKW